MLLFLFNCSWTKFIAIIVNVCLFYAKFSLDNFDFSSDFYALDFLRFAWYKIISQSQFHAAELNWRQFNTESQMKSAPKLVPFFTLYLNSSMLTSNVVIWSPQLNFLVPFRLPPLTEAGCNWLELPVVVREQFVRHLVGNVFTAAKFCFLLPNFAAFSIF